MVVPLFSLCVIHFCQELELKLLSSSARSSIRTKGCLSMKISYFQGGTNLSNAHHNWSAKKFIIILGDKGGSTVLNRVFFKSNVSQIE